MVQQISSRVWQAEARTEETKSSIRGVKHVTRRKFTPEEKIRIVLEGLRHELRTPRFNEAPGSELQWSDSRANQVLEEGKE